MPSNHLILCHPLLLLSSIFPSIRVFSNESALHIRRPKYWSFSFSISPSNEHSGLSSFRMDWLDLLAVQGTLKSLFQHHSLKVSILWLSAFFIGQLSHPHMTTGKTIALTRRTFVGKVISLLFNILSGLVITFLPKSKRLYFFSPTPAQFPMFSCMFHHWAICLLSFWFLFLRFFLIWTFLNVFIEFVTNCFFFVFRFFWLRAVWHLGSRTRD